MGRRGRTDHVERRGLACAVRAQEREDRVRADAEAHPVDDAALAERLGHVHDAQRVVRVALCLRIALCALPARAEAQERGPQGRTGVRIDEDRKEGEAVDDEVEDRAAVVRDAAEERGLEYGVADTKEGEDVDGDEACTSLETNESFLQLSEA